MLDGDVSPKGWLIEAAKLLRPFWAVVTLVTLFGMTGGGLTGLLLSTVNRGLQQEGSVTSSLLLQFAGLCFLVLAGRSIAGVGNSAVGQRLIARMRTEISARILDVPLAAIERFGAHRILAVLNDDIDNVSAFTFNISGYCISLAVTLGCIIYMIALSPWLFPITLVALAMGLCLNFATRKGWNGYYNQVRIEQDELQIHYRAVTEGAKELRLNHDRRSRIHGDLLTKTANRIADLKIRAMRLFWAADAAGSTLFFVTIGAFLALKGHLGIDTQTISGFVITLLFVKGPLDQILSGVPSATIAIVSLRRIAALSDLLDEEPVASPRHLPSPTLGSIGLRNVQFVFAEEQGFTLGPVDLTIKRGEAIFLVGENGSGKTTLLKLLTGLYTPASGDLLLNGTTVSPKNRGGYVTLFSAVFSDYFLFSDLPNDRPASIARASKYLERFEISEKVTIQNGRFSTTELSTGQRKRLALIQACLEDRPIMVFDEWAADQDPVFRRIFYTEFLPELKREGKTLIVVSHDDRYFDAADRLLELRSGCVRDSGPLAVGTEDVA
jgi:putative pyoverdin transport system ATP-binding/permease protein